MIIVFSEIVRRSVAKNFSRDAEPSEHFPAMACVPANEQSSRVGHHYPGKPTCYSNNWPLNGSSFPTLAGILKAGYYYITPSEGIVL
jgi:hypothetical protein